MNTFVTLLTLTVCWTAGDAELKVLDAKGGGPQPAAMLGNYLQGLAPAAFARRREEVEKLQTPEQCQAYQQQRRTFFVQQLGGFPDRTPLNAQVVGQLKGDGYRVEKVMFESRPQHHVTAALYLPEGPPPFHAVLIACGHSKNGKAADYNQRMGILLAKHGLAAMCYDPIGQGERSQVLTPDGKATLGATTEHFLVGVGAMLVGTNTAQYRIYDGMRAIDYLLSRPDIVPDGVGCTGCSGGGTLTSYLMALDDRVACAAPACYVTTFERLLETIGPQDAEQNIFAQVALGMEQTDYVLMRAPRPTLLVATTQDFFDIQGTWDTFRQAKRFYARFGFPERVDLVEDEGKHGVTKLNRATLTHWMRRWLLGRDEHVTEPDFPLWKDEELQCSPQGHVLLMPGEKTAYDYNIALAERLAAQRRAAAKSPDDARRTIRQVAGIRPLADLPAPQVRQVGPVQREGFRIERLVLEPEPGLVLPALAFVPAQPNDDAYLYLHEDGKQADAGAGGPIEKLVAAGHLVLAVDLPGTGETQSGGRDRGLLGDWKNAFLAYLLGKSLVGLRAEHVLQSAQFLAGYHADRPRRVHVLAVGECGVPALHAAAVEPPLFAAVTLRRTLAAWEHVVRTPESKNEYVNAVHGALAHYDLPDLVRLVTEAKVHIEDPVDARGQPLPK